MRRAGRTACCSSITGRRGGSRRFASPADARAEFAEHLRDIIELYEPRLTKVVVIARSPEDVQSEDPTLFKFGAVYLRIRATLKLDPFPIDGILFDTMLDLNSGVHKVSQPGVLR